MIHAGDVIIRLFDLIHREVFKIRDKIWWLYEKTLDVLFVRFFHFSTDNGLLLQIDSIMYRLHIWCQVDDFQLDDGCLYLGEVQSSVPEDQRPEEDFQVNNTYDF